MFEGSTTKSLDYKATKSLYSQGFQETVSPTRLTISSKTTSPSSLDADMTLFATIKLEVDGLYASTVLARHRIAMLSSRSLNMRAGLASTFDLSYGVADRIGFLEFTKTRIHAGITDRKTSLTRAMLRLIAAETRTRTLADS